jgi:formylglycine-generating enzyme required for sulfatase activity
MDQTDQFKENSEMIRIYLSSTFEDLQDYRKAVFDALRRVSHYKVIAMEDYVAMDQRPVEKCLRDVADSHIYVGLFGFRYGYVPPPEHGNPDRLSITELEFRHAQDLGKPYLIFVADLDANLSRKFDDKYAGDVEGKNISRLREELCRECMTGFFASPHQLASLVQSAVTVKVEELKSSGVKFSETIDSPPTVIWDISKKGPPYPGLMHFTQKFSPVFFGREAEVLEILDRIHGPRGRFIIVSGNSGTGKSSLVDAGVLSRLRETGLLGGKSCTSIRMVPSQGAHPLDSLRGVLQSYVMQAGLDAENVGKELLAGMGPFSRVIRQIIADGIGCDELVLFLDQMEELFSIRGKDRTDESSAAFLSALYHAVHETPLRVIATIRGDFIHHLHQHPDMLNVLKGAGHYPIGPLPPQRLGDIIEKPARCAGLKISPTLVCRLLQDTAGNPGNLPLLAFVLERICRERDGDTLSERAYDDFGGIDGAIAEHVARVEAKIVAKIGQDALIKMLPRVFQALMVVGIEGQPTRRRALKVKFSAELQAVLDGYLIPGRLLCAEGEGEDCTVSVVHEKLFEAWPALARYIAENREDLLMLHQAELEANEWHRRGFSLNYLWHPERIKKLRQIVSCMKEAEISPKVLEFAAPQERLLNLLGNKALTHQERHKIGEIFVELGDLRPGVGLTGEGIPAIEWVDIPAGTVKLEDIAGVFSVKAFRIARYPVTYCQFQAFIEAPDGYGNPRWWESFMQSSSPGNPNWRDVNCPRETVSWYEAVAFCRWLTEKLRERGMVNAEREIRLPAEWEWQQAATGGNPENVYPWGADWDSSCCNSAESYLKRTTAVGLYLHGTWPGGPLDMAGNIWEWCLNTYANPRSLAAVRVDESERDRVVRGGSWHNKPQSVRASYRSRTTADYRGTDVGFRLALDVD